LRQDILLLAQGVVQELRHQQSRSLVLLLAQIQLLLHVDAVLLQLLVVGLGLLKVLFDLL
jgi:hypothetical protein